MLKSKIVENNVSKEEIATAVSHNQPMMVEFLVDIAADDKLKKELTLSALFNSIILDKPDIIPFIKYKF